MTRTRGVRILLLVLVVGIPIALRWNGATRTSAVDDASGERALLDAFEARRSDVLVDVSGTIDRMLPDDRDGTPHQRFILRLSSGHTVLVSHNTAVAPRVPRPDTGQPVRVRGEYEWNREGGVVHWTHHDPRGRHPGGWIEYQGQRYE